MKVGNFFYWSYLVGLHLLLLGIALAAIRRGDGFRGLFSFTSGKQQYLYRQLVEFQSRVDELLGSGSVLFIGDSSIQSLNPASIVDDGINYGIGGDTTDGVLKRLPRYASLSRARAVVLWIGQNDLKNLSDERIEANFTSILCALPTGCQIVCCGILPIDEKIRTERYNQRTRHLNMRFRSVCEAFEGVKFVDFGPSISDESGGLAESYHIGDGMHLNATGRRLVGDRLRETLKE